VTVTQKGNGVSPKKATKVSPKKAHTIDTLKETSTKEIFMSDSIEYRLAKYLFKHIQKNNPNHKDPNLQTWAKSIDLMLRIDNRDFEEIKKVIKWCQVDGFWHKNILSTSKLREQYDRLILEMKDKEQGTNYNKPQAPNGRPLPKMMTEKDLEDARK